MPTSASKGIHGILSNLWKNIDCYAVLWSTRTKQFGEIKMETLKINYLIETTAITGGVRSLLNFANNLVERGHEVSITTNLFIDWFSISPDIKIISPGKLRNLYHLYVNYRWFHNYPNKYINSYKLLLEMNKIVPISDVNVATYSKTALVALWNSSKTPPFYHMQHMDTIFSRDVFEQTLIKDIYSYPIPKVANSIWLANLVKKLTGDDVPLLNPAIEHDIFYPRELDGKDGNYVDIIALGKGGWKNANNIVDAAKQIISEYAGRKRVRLHMFGRRQPPGFTTDNETMFFHKDISDDELARLYSMADIQVTFSTAESFPGPPLEAMACHTAVITTPYGAEDYAVDKENCLLVEPGDINGLRDALRLLIEDEKLRASLADNGVLTAKRFTYKGQTSKLEAYLRNGIDQFNESYGKLKKEFDKFNIPF